MHAVVTLRTVTVELLVAWWPPMYDDASGSRRRRSRRFDEARSERCEMRFGSQYAAFPEIMRSNAATRLIDIASAAGITSTSRGSLADQGCLRSM